jgi:hypothetical protein
LGQAVKFGTIDQTQRSAARAVGYSYLIAMVLALFTGFYVLGHLIVAGDAAQTARNIIAHERLFRVGIASDLLAFAVDVVLIASLYLVLKPVNHGLALLAAFFRVVETAIMLVITLNYFDVLRYLSAADYLHPFELDQLQALARSSLGAHSTGYNVGLMFAGIGSTIFCCLWFKSKYIPRALAVWGVFASLVLGACCFSFIIFPDLAKTLTIAVYGGPIFLFELGMGLWLVFRGLVDRAGSTAS